MKPIFPLFLIFSVFFSFYGNASINALENKTEKYLEKRIESHDKRYSSFLLVLELLQEHDAKILVETGTARNGNLNFVGDGGSTIIFGDWAAHHRAKLYSIDQDLSAIKNAKNATKLYDKYIDFVVGDSIAILENFNQEIDFLYLDSFEYECENPNPSQEHHLKEIVTAYPFLHQNSIVMLDDCDLPSGGQGKFVIDFLLSNGWKIIHEGYQTILIQKNDLKYTHDDFLRRG
jgi:predicted O-methyltransferase YrrM